MFDGILAELQTIKKNINYPGFSEITADWFLSWITDISSLNSSRVSKLIQKLDETKLIPATQLRPSDFKTLLTIFEELNSKTIRLYRTDLLMKFNNEIIGKINQFYLLQQQFNVYCEMRPVEENKMRDYLTQQSQILAALLDKKIPAYVLGIHFYQQCSRFSVVTQKSDFNEQKHRYLDSFFNFITNDSDVLACLGDSCMQNFNQGRIVDALADFIKLKAHERNSKTSKLEVNFLKLSKNLNEFISHNNARDLVNFVETNWQALIHEKKGTHEEFMQIFTAVYPDKNPDKILNVFSYYKAKDEKAFKDTCKLLFQVRLHNDVFKPVPKDLILKIASIAVSSDPETQTQLIQNKR